MKGGGVVMTINEAMSIVEKKEPSLRCLSAIEYEDAFHFCMCLPNGAIPGTGSTYEVVKKNGKARWRSIFLDTILNKKRKVVAHHDNLFKKDPA